MRTLDDKLAVVTGASRGIGLAIADRLHARGAHVVRMARSVLANDGDRRTDIPCDVTDRHAVTMASHRIAKFGRGPDVLINNAGGFLLKPVHETSLEEFYEQLQVNLVAPFGILRALLPGLAEARGHLVTIGSIADHVALPGNAAYGASKFGLRAVHDVLAAEYRGRVRATLISPGPTDTSLWDAVDPDNREDLPDRSVMLRPEDVADAVEFVVTRPRHANVELIRIGPSWMG